MVVQLVLSQSSGESGPASVDPKVVLEVTLVNANSNVVLDVIRFFTVDSVHFGDDLWPSSFHATFLVDFFSSFFCFVIKYYDRSFHMVRFLLLIVGVVSQGQIFYLY